MRRDVVDIAEGLNLELSLGQQGNSTLVTNNSRVAAIVVKRLAYRGVSIKVQNTARDLGVLLVGGAGRRTSIQHNRMLAAGPRFSRLRWLSRICYRARRVGRSNPYAVAFWGVEVLGLAPSQLKSFRAQAAASTGMTQAQRCATTAIAIGFGSDPAEEVLRRQLVSFFRFVRAKALAMAAVPGKFRVAWTEAKAKITGAGAIKWRCVNGPLGALIAQLTEYGWNLRGIDDWVAPDGESNFTLDPRSPIENFVKWVCERTREVLWERAAEHYCGRGLEEGGPDPCSFNLLRSLRKAQRHPEAGALECILTGGFWFPARVHEAYPAVTSACPWCGHHRAYPLHMWWTCPHHKESKAPAIVNTQWMVEQAIAPGAMPCLWSRGLLPARLLTEQIPTPDAVSIWYVGWHIIGFWPGGTYYTDGSGGKYSSIPLLRRCGCGIAKIDDAGALTMDFGVYFGLEGSSQTVPRAEMFANIVLCLLVAPHSAIRVGSDSAICVAGIANRQKSGGHWDMWGRLWKIV